MHWASARAAEVTVQTPPWCPTSVSPLSSWVVNTIWSPRAVPSKACSVVRASRVNVRCLALSLAAPQAGPIAPTMSATSATAAPSTTDRLPMDPPSLRPNELAPRAPSGHRHHHLGPGVALFQVGDGRGDLGEPVAPVDLGADLAGLEQRRQPLQVGGGDVGLDHGDVLAAAQRDRQQPAHAGEAGDGGPAALGQRLAQLAHRPVPDGVEDAV